MSADQRAWDIFIPVQQSRSKRQNERRLSILRRSIESGDFAKRRKDLQEIDMTNQSRGRVDVTQGGRSDGNCSQTPRSSTRQDLFGEQGTSPTGVRNAVMIANQAFELSPRGANSPHQSPHWRSGTQAYARAVSTPSQTQQTGGGSASATGSPKPDPTRETNPSPIVDSQTRSGSPSSSQQGKSSPPPLPDGTNGEDDVIIGDIFSDVEVNTKAEGLLPESTGKPEVNAVEVDHTFNFEAQSRMQIQKRRGEDCGCVLYN
ncbi:hypothetical protein R1sor_027065 [Riccia sorocarpa]|uniref:Uncharacterized protein n=1 Tax=Riccia sorocarpa TaxID=122646 RepID=A0ABD3GD51_9MARC